MIDPGDLVQHSSLEALAWALLHFLWQGAVLGFGAFLVLRLGRPERASTRYAFGVATLALMLATCAATFVMLSRQPPASPVRGVEAATTAAAGLPAIATLDDPRGDTGAEGTNAPARAPLDPVMLLAIVVAWAIGVLALSFRLVGGWMLTRQLVRRAVTEVSPALNAMARDVAGRLRLQQAVEILESSAVNVPTLVGWVKPVVLLPAAALAGLSPEQLQAILAHELAHVRRHDYLINLLQSMVETLLFYHPATWWVSAQVRAEREHCCDDLAIEVCGDRLVYVSALAELTTMATHSRLALAATDGSLVGRVQRILGRPRSMREPAPAWALLAILVLVVGSVGSFSAAGDEHPEPPVIQSGAIAGAIKPVDLQQALKIASAQDAAIASAQDAAIAARSNADQETVAELLRAEAARLRAEADRLRAEADRIRRVESQLREAPLAPVAPVAPVAPLAPLAPEAPQAPKPPEAPAPQAPQAPEAPKAPAPQAPEAPKAPEIGSRGSGNMTWSNDGEHISVRWTGAFRLSDDEKDVAWVEEGTTVTLSEGRLFSTRVVLKGLSGGRIDRSFSKSGSSRDYEPEGRQFLASALDLLIRHTAMFARDRVTRFLKQGGPNAVLTEIDRLGDSSYVKRVYYSELLKQAPLSDDLLARVLQRVPVDLKSNYDKATLLTQAAALPAITDAHRVNIARAAKSISSNYDQRRTLMAVLSTNPVAPPVAAAVLDAASSIGSSYDRSQVLIEVAQRDGLTPATSPAFMNLVRSTPSSYDQRRVLTAVAARAPLAGSIAAEAVIAAGTITGSHDQSTVLITLIDRGGLTDASSDAFFKTAANIQSSHDLQRVLRRALAQPSISDRIVQDVLRVAPRVSGSHDRANVLVDAAGRARLSDESRELYVAAARGLGTHDENRALAALVRNETRR